MKKRRLVRSTCDHAIEQFHDPATISEIWARVAIGEPLLNYPIMEDTKSLLGIITGFS
jgi:hypothetical protein